MPRWFHAGPLLAALLVLCLAAAHPAAAISLIRDGEIETYVRELADPVFKAAELDPESIDLYLVNDDQLNAFVAGGQNLFINTGLLRRAGDPEQVRGVIAHETGHIAGGHLSRMGTARENAMFQTLLGAALGAAAAVAGAPQLAPALFAGGATLAQSGFLKFSRVQEEAADQAAVTYLATLHRSPQGLIDFFQVMQRASPGAARGNPFLQSHPVTQDRIQFLQNQVARSPYRDVKPDPAQMEMQRRTVAKLDGFLAVDPQQVLRVRNGDSIADRYACAIALYRISDLGRAVPAIDGLLAVEPQNPWFWELKGQMLFENGRIQESVAPYRKAVQYQPSSSLLRLGLGRALLEQNDPASLDEAAAMLRETVRLEPKNAGAWRFLGIAEGKRGNEGQASMALAEYAVLVGDRQDAMLYLQRAQSRIQPDEPDWYRLQDLMRAAQDLPPPGRGRG